MQIGKERHPFGHRSFEGNPAPRSTTNVGRGLSICVDLQTTNYCATGARPLVL